MYGNNEFLDCCSVCYKFNSIINHEKDLYCVKKNVPFSNRNIFRNNSCRPTFNVSIFKIRYSGEKFTENQCWWSFTFSISFSDWYFTGFVSLFSLKSNLYRGGSCPVCMPRELMLMMITTVGTLHTGSEGKITFRFLQVKNFKKHKSWDPHRPTYLYNNLSISVRVSVRTLSPPTFMVRFEL